MSAGAFLAGLAGAMIMTGVWLAVLGLRRMPPAPARPARVRGASRWSKTPLVLRWAALAAFVAGWVIGLVTGWWIAIIVLPIAVLALPAVLMVSGEGKVIARLEAMSEWTRSLAGVLTAGHARALLGVPRLPEMKELAAQVTARKLSVRDTEKLVQQAKAARGKDAAPAAPAPARKPGLQAKSLVEELQRKLGTKVRLTEKGSGKGTLEVDYFSYDDLDRILKVLRKE